VCVSLSLSVCLSVCLSVSVSVFVPCNIRRHTRHAKAIAKKDQEEVTVQSKVEDLNLLLKSQLSVLQRPRPTDGAQKECLFCNPRFLSSPARIYACMHACVSMPNRFGDSFHSGWFEDPVLEDPVI
jgi:hypothetical protein